MVSLVPITPGGVGVTEVAYIGILSSLAGSGLTGQLTAAVMLFRIVQWFLPIPHRVGPPAGDAAGPLGRAAQWV